MFTESQPDTVCTIWVIVLEDATIAPGTIDVKIISTDPPDPIVPATPFVYKLPEVSITWELTGIIVPANPLHWHVTEVYVAGNLAIWLNEHMASKNTPGAIWGLITPL